MMINANTVRIMTLALALLVGTNTAMAERTFRLSYFMGSKHPMNAAVFTPFGERLAELSDSKLLVKQYPGGALNSAPAKQYAILRNGVADVALVLPGYTAQLFPITNVISVPGVASSSYEGTAALNNAYDLIKQEYDAQILALWTNDPPVLITRDKAVRRLEDIKGMKVRVNSVQDVPFIEALGANPVSQPVSVVNRNLQNGTIDAVVIDPAGIRVFNLWEPANFVTVGIPGSGAAFMLLMNNKVWHSLSAHEKAWVREASGFELSRRGAAGYKDAGDASLALAKANGVEIIELSDDERARFHRAIESAYREFMNKSISGQLTGADVVHAMKRN
jgi:TRAP-type C4-dicarboxylate transport system substrate-binding protein